MRYLSVCSGIEAATVAWKPLGWEAAGFAEIDKFPSAVLDHHYPKVTNHGDFTTIKAEDVGTIDLLVGGTPCQSFSIAGLRGGLADDRGNLALEFLRLAERIRPRWLVWENVPGVLSSNGGRDFGSILGGMVELRYGFFYRVLDAQYFGLAQRRKRVLVVGYFGDWRPAAAVFLERESLSWNSPPRRKARKDIAPTISARTKGGGGLGTDFDCDGGLITPPITRNPYGDHESREGLLVPSTGNVAHCLNAGGMGRIDCESETLITHALRGEGFDASEDGTGRGTPLVALDWQNSAGGPNSEDTFQTLTADRIPAVAFSCKDHGAKAGSIAYNEDIAPTLSSAESGTNRTPALMNGSTVRRLTPRECERLMGFPDDYTLIPYRGTWLDIITGKREPKMSADGPRYRALGNSMAVPVMRWIGERIDRVEAILSTNHQGGDNA